MSSVSRKGDSIRLRFSEDEALMLESLLDQLVGLLGPREPSASQQDPIEQWQAESEADAHLDLSDPVVARLFPEAYPDDPQASAEFGRFTRGRQARRRLDEAAEVAAALRGGGAGRRTVRLREAEAEVWLRGLTALRLSLAVRLGIRQAVDAEELEALPSADPRAYVYQVYEWLGYLTEALLAAMEG